jgi:long-chain acyl-CoA synthetase
MTAPSQTPSDPAPAAPRPVAADLRKDDPRTAVELWKRRLAATPAAVAFRYYDRDAWQGMTFGEADAIAREIAAGLVARGVVPGDRVCIVSQTRVEWVLCDIAIMLAGGIAVPIYASNTAEQCEFIVRDAGAKIVLVEDAAQRDKLVGLRNKLFTVAHVVQLTGEPPIGLTPPPAAGTPMTSSRFVQSLAELRAAGRQWGVAHPGELDAHAETVAPESMFTIIYTSGTTGVPKGVVLTHENLTAGTSSAIRAMQIETVDLQYLFLPLAHVLGRELEWCTIQMGCETAFSRGTAMIKEDLVAIRPTFMAGVPRIFEKFHAGVKTAMGQGSGLKRKIAAWALRVGAGHSAAVRAGQPGGGFSYWLADKLVFSKLRAKLGLDRASFLISGGAPLAAEIAEFFHGAGILILEGYGLTETVAAAFLNTRERFRFGTVGPALDVVETKIADDGEILMRGPSVFRQYYNNAAATGRVGRARRLVPFRRHRPDRGRLPAHHRPQEGPDRDRGRQEDRAAGAGERAQGALAALQPGAGLRRQAAILRGAGDAVRRRAQALRRGRVRCARGVARRQGGAAGRGRRAERDPGVVRVDQEVRDPPRRPDRGLRRSDAQAERQAQGRHRQVPAGDRRAVPLGFRSPRPAQRGEG